MASDRDDSQPRAAYVARPVRVVLVRPRGGANVGAVCRAIKNMGAGELVTVSAEFDREEARRMAVHAADVLDASRDVSRLRDALDGCGLVVGTTARAGAYRERSRDIRALAGEIASAERASADSPTGLGPVLVFGPEDAGLSNRDIALCHQLASIPTDDAYSSLNLSQAVLVCLYEVLRARDGGPAERPVERADAAAVEEMLEALERALVDIGFLATDNPEHVMATIRALLVRGGLDERELRILRGIARQVSWFAGGGYETARAKRERGQKLR